MSSRQDLTWSACDALAAEGRKPSIGLVREWTIAHTGAKKGSDGDVQKDINAWFDDLLKLKRDKAITDLPDPVAALARDMWRLAVDAAQDSLAQQRSTLEAEKLEMEKLIDLAQEDTVAAVEIANHLKGKIAIAGETIAGRDETIKRLEASLLETQSRLQYKEERIADLTAEVARQAEERAAAIAEIDGVRKHSLLQIDQARNEVRQLKSDHAKLDAENKTARQRHRETASSLEAELAGARGRMSALEEALAASRQRIDTLETDLSAAKTAPAIGPRKPSQRISVTKAGSLASTRRRKL